MKLKRAYARLTLRTKMTALAVLISTGALAIVATAGILEMRAQIQSEQHHSADSVALGIAQASELPMTVGDNKEMSRLADSFLKNPEILFIAAYGNGAAPVVVALRDHDAWNNYLSGHEISPRWVSGQAFVKALRETEDFSSDPGEASDPKHSGAIVREGLVGRIVIGLSTEASLQAQARLNTVIVDATCGAAALSGLVLFITLSVWLRRLQRLDVAAQSIAQGDFSTSVDDTKQDEIGRLSHSFEEMRLALLGRDLKLREFTETLQQLVSQRTCELEAALAVARDANHAKSLFLANMSHELRTPLNGVVGMVNLLLNTPTTAQQRRYCDVAKVSAQSLLELINDILDFSKIEAGKLELDSTDFNLHNAVESVTQILGERAESKKLELLCSIAPDVPTAVTGDPIRVRQMVMNMISNAIKFTEQGEVVLSMTVVDQNETEANIKVTVRDTGVGIPKDRMERLFKSFSQVDASTTRKYGGTGLGLAISCRIARLMGGEMGVESEVGKGSTFWFTAKLRKRTVLKVEPSPRRDPRGIRALAVDDNATNREILKAQLSSWSIRADLARNAAEALHMLRDSFRANDPYRIAIVDMQMPCGNGEQLARDIKSDELTRDVILLGLSSIGDQLKPSERGRLGFAACLSKPVLPSALYDALTRALSNENRCEIDVPVEPQMNSSLLANVRVLLAEDNEVNQMVATEILRQVGCQITLAVNGREALDMSAHAEFDVILMDCQMPEMDGFAATKLIRERESLSSNGRRIPIIALTANAIKGDREICLAAGMDGYSTKPIEPAELFKTIMELLGPMRAVRAAVKPAAVALPHPFAPTESRELPAKSAEGASQTGPPIDFESLEKRCLGNRQLAAKALESFVGTIGNYTRELSSALQSDNLAPAAAAAHKLKGAAANLSAKQLHAMAAQLEINFKNHSIDGAQTLLDDLTSELERLRDYVAGPLKELTAASKAASSAGPNANAPAKTLKGGNQVNG